MSSSKKSRSNRPRRPTFAIVLLVAFILLVFTFIGFRQVRSAEERRLRLLAGFANRIEATVPDLADRFRRIAGGRCADQVADYLEVVPYVEHLTVQPSDRECPQPGSQGDSDDGAIPDQTVGLRADNGAVTVRFCRGGDCVYEGGVAPSELEDSAVTSAEARIDLAGVLEPMIIPGIFDSVVIADRSGQVLHQQGEAELKVAHLGALLGGPGEEGDGADEERPWIARWVDRASQAGAPFLELVRGDSRPEGSPSTGAGDPGATTAIVDTKIADASYSVFVQPVILTIDAEEGQPTPEPRRWVAVGIISSERLLSAGVTTSPILLFLLVSVLPLGLISWPFLKLALISRRQRFTRFDCAFLVLSTVLALSFGALLLVDGLFMTRVQQTIDAQLEELSGAISRSLKMELVDARLQLAALDDAVDGGDDSESGGAPLADLPDYFEFRKQKEDAGEPGPFAESFIREEVTSSLTSLGRPTIYPYFDSVFWPDPEGDVEGATLPLRKHAVLPQNVKDRDYVQCADEWEDPVSLRINGPLRTDYLRRRCEECDDPAADGCDCAAKGLLPRDGSLELCLSAVLDRTTGEAITAVSMPGPDPDRRPVAAMVTQLTSVHHPVLPPEVSFAVVEPSGRVLFHSDSRRALTENLLEASDENRLLQSLLEARREGELNLHYWGRRHRAFVRTIQPLPWSLVVFRNMEDVRLRNFELVYDFLNPFLLHLAVLALLAAAFKWMAPSHVFRAYLWPSTRNLTAYRRIVVWALLTSTLFLYLLWRDDLQPGWIFAASLLVCPVTFAIIVRFLPALHRAEQDEPSLLRPLVLIVGGLGKGIEQIKSFGGRVKKFFGRLLGSGDEVQKPDDPGEDGPSLESRLALRLWAKRLVLWVGAIAGAIGVYGLLRAGHDPLIVWLLAAVVATAACLWLFRLEFDGERRKVAYTFALSSLLLVSLLPVLGFLDLARSRQIQLATQDTMTSLAGRLESRIPSIEGRQGPVPYYHEYRHEMACTRDAHLRAVFGTALVESGSTELVPCTTSEAREAAEARSDSWLWSHGLSAAQAETESRESSVAWLTRRAERTLSARPVALNDLSATPVGVDLSRFESTDGEWTRREDGTEDRLVLTTDRRDRLTRPLELASTIPAVDSFVQESFPRELVFFLGFVLLGFAPYLLARFIAEKLVLIGLVYHGEKRTTEKKEEEEEGGGSGGESSPRHGESLQDVLEEARDRKKLVRRLVIVAGELDREGWAKLVGEDQEDGEDPELFHEARFRESWELASAGVSTAEAAPSHAWETEESQATGAEEKDSEQPEESESIEPGPHGPAVLQASRRKRFEKELKGDSAEGRPILLTHFQPELEDMEVAKDQTAALLNLMEREGRSLVILSDTVPVTTDESENPPDADEARMRWIELLGSFPVRYAHDFNYLETFENRVKGLRGQVGRDRPESHVERARARHWKTILDTVDDECRHTPTLRILGHQLLTEMFIEVGRAIEDRTIETAKQRLADVEDKLATAREDLEKHRSETAPEDPELGAGEREHRETAKKNAEDRYQQLEDLRKELQDEIGEAQGRLERIKESRNAEEYRNLLTEDHVIARVGAGARLHYRYLWSQCNRDEKLTLVHLAKHGLVNPKSFGWVLDLMHKGLVIRAPDLRLMNRSFRKYVLQEYRRSQELEWEEELGPNAWSVLKWILPFPLLGLAVFLFITQQDAVSNAAGVLVALASLTPVVFNLYEKFQEVNLRRERAEPSGEPE